MPAGISVAIVHEGSRIILAEVQALAIPSKSGVMRVYSDRIDPLRVSRIAAVLEKQTRLDFSSQEIYVNVAGGLRLTEPAVDLPLACALYSARTGQALPDGAALAGELSLAGEIRPVRSMDRRAKAAAQLGFAHILGPRGALPGEGAGRVQAAERAPESGEKSIRAARGTAGSRSTAGVNASASARWAGVASIKEALRILWTQEQRT